MRQHALSPDGSRTIASLVWAAAIIRSREAATWRDTLAATATLHGFTRGRL